MSIPTTRNRITRVTLDENLPVVLQPLYVFMKQAKDMAKGPCPEKSNVILVDDTWQLESYHVNFGNSILAAIASSWMTPVTAAYHESKDTQRESGFSGVTYTGTSVTAMPMFQKKIPAGVSFAQTLAPDAAALPQPDTAEDIADMDRVAYTSASHDPLEGLFLAVRIPAHAAQGISSAVTMYFNGPASADCTRDGNGQYALKIYGDGRGRLYERTRPVTGGSYSWTKRKSMMLFTAMGVGTTMLYLSITNSLRKKTDGSYVGDTITITPSTSHRPGSGDIESLITYAIHFLKTLDGISPIKYIVPRKRNNAIQTAPVRLDTRRDLRPQWIFGKLLYKPSGYLIDDPFTLPFFPDTSKKLTVEFYGKVPTDTTLTMKLYNAETDVEIAADSVFTDALGGIYTFTPAVRQNRYYVKFLWTSNTVPFNGHTYNLTPKLASYRVFREPVVETPVKSTTTFPQRDFSIATPGLNKADVTRVDIKGNSGDPRQESASITIEDYFNKNSFLRSRANYPIKIETAYDTVPNYTTLFKGYVRAPKCYRKGRDPNRSYPDQEWYSCVLDCTGEWQRLSEMKVPKRYFFWDKTVDAPMKITDIVRILLYSLGYPTTMVSIPDLPIRLFAINEEDYIIEPGSLVAEFIIRLVADYLGAYFIFDEAAGTYGKWRIIRPQKSPYNNLVIFEERQLTPLTLPHIADAYGTTTGGLPYGSQTILKTFMQAGTILDYAEPMEGNIVTVHGLATGSAASREGGNDSMQLTSVAVNVHSFNALNLGTGDPNYPSTSHQDWVGRMIPIDVYDASLTSQAACDWVCRRIFDYACHNRIYKSFSAPLLLVTNTYDTEQVRPRKLRFGDAVQVRQRDGTLKQFLVLNCTPTYTRDAFQFAHYELVTMSNINDYGVPVGHGAMRGALLGVMQEHMGQTHQTPQHISSQRTYSTMHGEWARLPEKSAKSLQILDPADPNFGRFYFMSDYGP